MSPTELPKFVLPGEYLGAAEEFLPGRGTYEYSGRIFASVVGTPTIDPSDRTVRVDAANAVPVIGDGDVVYARVDELKTAMAVCTILASTRSERGIPGEPEGTVHVSKAKEGYTDSLADEFAVGDLILARVLQSHPSVKLTTASSELGVVAGRCQLCHGLLAVAANGSGLVCPRCGHRERRKLAQGPRPGPPTS